MAIAAEAKEELKQAVGTLNGLIETCKDGEKGFTTAAEKVSDVSLKSLFTKYATQRAQYAAELQTAVAGLGSNPADSGHVAATLHRGWISVKGALTSDTDKAIIDECEAGEDAAMKNYKDALTKVLPPSIRTLIEGQFQGVQAAHGVVRDLKHSRQN